MQTVQINFTETWAVGLIIDLLYLFKNNKNIETPGPSISNWTNPGHWIDDRWRSTYPHLTCGPTNVPHVPPVPALPTRASNACFFLASHCRAFSALSSSCLQPSSLLCQSLSSTCQGSVRSI